MMLTVVAFANLMPCAGSMVTCPEFHLMPKSLLCAAQEQTAVLFSAVDLNASAMSCCFMLNLLL